MISFEAVTKRVGPAVPMLSGVTAIAGSGKVTVILGPAERGPSMMLQLVNRLARPDQGTIRLDGDDVAGLHAVTLRRRIGWHSTTFFAHLTPVANVAVATKLHRQHRRRGIGLAGDLLERFGVPAHLVDQPIERLSPLNRSRVALARAVAAEPAVVLIDEPFRGLDHAAIRELVALLSDYISAHHPTVMIATGDLEPVLGVADEVHVIGSAGRLLQSGRPAQLLSDPVDEEVETLVGRSRGLRRLALAPATEVAADATALIELGATVASARELATRAGRWLLVTDNGRALGWLDTDRLGTGSLTEVPLVAVSASIAETDSVLDVLDRIVASPSRLAVRCDDDGSVLGVVSLAALEAHLPDGAP